MLSYRCFGTRRRSGSRGKLATGRQNRKDGRHFAGPGQHANVTITMNRRFTTVAVLGREHDPQIAPALGALLEQLRAAQVHVLVDRTLAPLLGNQPDAQLADAAQLATSAQLAIVIGGDGTLLKAVHLFCQRPIALVGINLGRLGFLTDISPQSLATDVSAILRGEYHEEQRLLLEAQVLRGTQTTRCAPALNDVVIQKTDGGRMLEFATYVDNKFVCAHRADGIIIATPTGSTAYALSGGGSILHPALDALILVPICPHALGDRPIVLSSASQVEIVIGHTRGGRAQVTSDGQDMQLLSADNRVRVRRASAGVTFIHPHGHDYYHVLRTKLLWGPTSAHGQEG